MSGSSRTIHVLHVDDHSDITSLSTDLLPETDDRVKVQTAASVSEALTILAETDIDCIVYPIGNLR